MMRTRILAGAAMCAALIGAETAAAFAEAPTSGGAPPVAVQAPAANVVAAPEVEAPRVDLALAAGAPITAAVAAPVAMPVASAAERPPRALRTEAAQGRTQEQALTLRFEDLQTFRTTAPFVRVFVGKPDADAATPVNDPHFAGAVSFFPLPMAAPQEVKVNVGPTRDRLQRMGLPADEVTLVLVTPSSAAPEAADGSGFGAAAPRAAPSARPSSVRVTRIELDAGR